MASSNSVLTEALVKVTPNDPVLHRLTFAMVIVIFIYVLFMIVKLLRKEGFDAGRALSVGSSLGFQSETGNPVYQSMLHGAAGTAANAVSKFTGSFSPEAPSFWESDASRADYTMESGLTSNNPNAFAETSWSGVEMAVFPNLTPQLKSKYFNASTAEKLNILSGAAAALGVPLPAALPTGSTVSGMYTPKGSQLSNFANDEKLASKLGK